LDDAVDPETLILGLEASAKGSNPGTGTFYVDLLVFWPAQFLQDNISRVPDWEGGIKFGNFSYSERKAKYARLAFATQASGASCGEAVIQCCRIM